jgi:hypothetical protein
MLMPQQGWKLQATLGGKVGPRAVGRWLSSNSYVQLEEAFNFH